MQGLCATLVLLARRGQLHVDLVGVHVVAVHTGRGVREFVHLPDRRHHRLQYQPERKQPQHENAQERQAEAEAGEGHSQVGYL